LRNGNENQTRIEWFGDGGEERGGEGILKDGMEGEHL
jgi:hypothetical protein